MSEPGPAHAGGVPGDRMVMLILAYLWILALVPLLSRRRDPEVEWHAKHGIVLTVFEFGGLFVWTIVASMLWLMTGGLLGCLVTLELVVTPLLGLVVIAFHIVSIFKAIQGHKLKVPVISDFADRF